MVEVMLAVVVIAVGMASVFVLFPTGLSAHKTAVAENAIADFAEYVISTVKARVASEAEKDYDVGSPNFDTFKSGLKIYSDSGTSPSYKNALDIESTTNRKPLDNDSSNGSTNDADENDAFLLDSDGYILIRQISGPAGNRYVDFAAVAVIKENTLIENFRYWKFDNDGKVVGNEQEELGTGLAGKLKKRFLASYVLEISYPADKEWEEREKRYFPFDLYNQYYQYSSGDNWLNGDSNQGGNQ